jgi:hypothetical protein
MAESSWPDPADGRVVDDRQYELLAAGSGLQVLVRANLYGSLRGHGWTSGPTNVPRTIAANGSGSTRTDLVVLRLERSTWQVRTAVVQGSPGAGAPALTRQTGDTGVFEIPLGEVTVPAGASSIAAENVRARTLYQAGTIRPVTAAADVQSLLAAGEVMYESGRWLGWTGTAAVPIYEDTGWVSLSAAGGWALNNVARVKKTNGVIRVRLSVQCINGVTTADADGSVAVNLPSQFRPTVDEPGFGFHSRSPVAVRVETTGAVRIFPLNDNIPAGRTVQAGATYLAG